MIKVVNSWNNRLAGDAELPQEKSKTFLTANIYRAETNLLPADLIGPVNLVYFTE